MDKYSVVLPSKDPERLKWCATQLIRNSRLLDQIVILYDIEHLTGKLWLEEDLNLRYLYKPDGLDVYWMYNQGVQESRTNNVILVNDDMYFPPDWDSGLSALPNPTTEFIFFSLVESGRIGVNERNIEKDCGRTLADFDQAAFDAFAKDSTHTLSPAMGWYMPVLFSRQRFLSLGGYPIVQPFPFWNDVVFFDQLKKLNTPFYTLDSRVYHFQGLSHA